MKTIKGTVTSVKDAKTARVLVSRKWQHPLYKKYVKRSKNYACHVEKIEVKVGDEVIIEETRPISKTKRFRVVSIIEK